MAKQGDGLPPQDVRALVDERLVPGAIVRLQYPFFLSGPAWKFAVFVGCDEDEDEDRCLLLFINTRKAPHSDEQSRIDRCQLTVRRRDYGFLTYDSYLDCSEVTRQLPLGELRAQLIAGTRHGLPDSAGVKGDLTNNDRAAVLKAVGDAPTISPWYKKIIREALS